MRKAILLTVASIAFSSIPLLAQQSAVSAHQGASAGAAVQENSTTSATSSAGAVETNTVSGELESKLDAKNAKAGETVLLKTTGKVTTADGTVLPKGTRLIGHVTEAQAHDSAHAESHLGITFDRAELKNGQSFLIHSTIESVNPRPDYTASSSMGGGDSFDTPVGGGMAGGRAMGGGRIAGGGLVGGAVGRTSIETANAGQHVASATEGTAHTTENIAGSSRHVTENATANTAESLHGAAASASTSNRAMAHSTGLPGVMLHNSDAANASGTLSASNKNVHLDSGTQMEVSFATAGK